MAPVIFICHQKCKIYNKFHIKKHKNITSFKAIFIRRKGNGLNFTVSLQYEMMVAYMKKS